MKMNRPYQSPLREQQAELTRRRIVEAAVRLVVGGVEGLTMPMVAREAEVALRTVFRHYPTRDDLLDATWMVLNEQIGDVPAFDRLRDLTGFIPELYRRYGAIEDQIRAVMLSRLMQASRLRQGSARRTALRQSFETLVQVPEDRAERMARSAAYIMTIPTAMLFLKDNYQLSTQEAAAAAAWAIETLVERSRTDPPKPPPPEASSEESQDQ